MQEIHAHVIPNACVIGRKLRMKILQNINHIWMKNYYSSNCQIILITVMMYIVNLYNIVMILIIYAVLLLIIV